MRHVSTLILTIFLFNMSSCRSSENKSSPLFTHIDSSELTGGEFEDFKINLSEAYLGSFRKGQRPKSFISDRPYELFEDEIELSLANKSANMKFLECEARGFFPSTADKKQCDYVLKQPSSTSPVMRRGSER